VAGRAQGRHAQSAGADHVAVRQVRVPGHPRLDLDGQPLREAQVVRVRVRDEHHADRRRAERAPDGRQVRVVVRARVDDDGHPAVAQQPRVGAGPGVRPRVGRQDAPDGGHPYPAGR
jgi:hypothetical protein